MAEIRLRFVYLTRPADDIFALNIIVDKQHTRYAISREQLFALNAAIAEILIHDRTDDQLVLQFEESARL